MNKHKCDAFFRICGDSPLLPSPFFDKAIKIYKNHECDLVTNVFPRTFPAGMSIELINSKKFLDVEKKVVKKDELEHVTKYFYKNSSNFNIYNIKSKKYINHKLKLSIDEVKDLKRLEKWLAYNGNNYKNFFL